MTGNDLKRLRMRLGKTQEQLAELLGYHGKQHIARLEARGRRNLPFGAVTRVQLFASSSSMNSRRSTSFTS